MMSKFRMLMIALISLFIFIGNSYASCGQPPDTEIKICDAGYCTGSVEEEPEWCILSIQECYPSQEEAEERIQELDSEQYQIATGACGGCGQRRCVWTFINGGWIWS